MEPAPNPETATIPKKRRWLLRLRKGLVRTFVVVMVLGFVLGLMLQIPWGANLARKVIISQVNKRVLWQGELDIGRLSGNFLTRLQIYDLTVVQNGEPVVQIDSIKLRYTLWPLLTQTVHIREALLYQTKIEGRQRADATWNFEYLKETNPNPLTWVTEVDQLTLYNGHLALHYYPPASDSTLHAGNLSLYAQHLVYTENVFQAQVDTLLGRLQMPFEIDALDVVAAGSFGEGQMLLDTLRATSSRSLITAGGIIAPLSEDGFNLQLAMQPLAFQDIVALVPGIDPNGVAEGRIELNGTGDHLYTHVDLQLSDGASVQLNGILSPDLNGPLVYQAQGEIHDFNPALLTGVPAQSGRINATFNVDLTGETLQTLNGTAKLDLLNTTWQGQTVGPTALSSQFTNGQAVFELNGEWAGAQLTTNGTARPFDDIPTYAIQGRFEDVVPANFLEGDVLDGQFSGIFSMEGRGTDVAGAEMTSSITLTEGWLEQVNFQETHLNTQLKQGRLQATLRTTFAQHTGQPLGNITALAYADLSTDDPTYRIPEGTFEHLDLSAWMGDPMQSSDLNGTFSLEGRGMEPASLWLDGQFHLRDARYDTYTIYTLDLGTHLERENLEFDLQSILKGGTLYASGSVQPLQKVPAYTITRGEFRQIDLGLLMQDATQTSNLNGTFKLAGTGFSPKTLQLQFETFLNPSQLNDQPFQQGFAQVNLSEDQAVFSAGLSLPTGKVALRGTAYPFQEVPTYTISEGSFEGINVGALLGKADWTTDLNGNLEATGQGFEPATAILTAQLHLISSRINQEIIPIGQATLRANRGKVRLESNVGLGLGGLMVVAEGRPFDDIPQYEILGQTQHLNIAALAGIDTLQTNLNLGFSLSGQGTDPETMDMAGIISAGPSVLDAVRIDTLLAQFNLSNGHMDIDTLLLASNTIEMKGSGPIAFGETAHTPSNFTFDGTVLSLEPLRRLLGATALQGEGLVSGRVTGKAGAPRFEVLPQLRFLTYDNIQMAGLKSRITGEYNEALRLRATAEAGYTTIANLIISESRFELGYTPEGAQFQAELEVDRRRDVRIKGNMDLTSATQVITFEEFSVRFDEERWELSQDARITREGDRYTARQFLLFANKQQIAIDGEIDFSGEQNLVVTIEQVRAEALTDLLGYPGLGGVLDAFLILSGPASEPLVEGMVGMRDITSNGVNVGSFSTDVNYEDFRLNLDASFNHKNGKQLTVNGYIPLDLSLQSVEEASSEGKINLVVQSDSFGIEWVQPFLDPLIYEGVGGYLTADVLIAGTQATPDLSGTVQIYDGRLGLVETNTQYRAMNGTATLTGTEATLQTFALKSGAGGLNATGTLDFTSLTVANANLDVHMDDFRSIWTETYQAVVDGDVVVKGTTEYPIITGNIALVRTDIFLTEELTSEALTPVELTERDLQTLKERFGYRIREADTTRYDAYIASEMDIKVKIDQDVWLRSSSSPEMAIQFTGELDLKKPSGDIYALLYGNVDANPDRSYVKQFGKRFDIEKGNMVFNGPIEEAIINLDTRYEVPSRTDLGQAEITIVLEIKGREDKLEFMYRTDPDYDLQIIDIVSYITFGRPAGEGFFGGSTEALGEQAKGLVIGELSNVIAAYAGAQLGLDVIQIDNKPEGTVITVGKYLTPRIYAAVSYPVTFNSSTQAGTPLKPGGLVELQLYSWMLLRLERRNDALAFNLLWEYAF